MFLKFSSVVGNLLLILQWVTTIFFRMLLAVEGIYIQTGLWHSWKEKREDMYNNCLLLLFSFVFAEFVCKTYVLLVENTIFVHKQLLELLKREMKGNLRLPLTFLYI